MTTNNDLTQPERRLLNALYDFHRQNGYGPTLRELAKAVGYRSPAAASYGIDCLTRKGLVTREYGVSRSIRPINTHTTEIIVILESLGPDGQGTTNIVQRLRPDETRTVNLTSMQFTEGHVAFVETPVRIRIQLA